MQEDKKPKKAKENNSFRRKKRSLFKNSLTGPTLLEMSGYAGGFNGSTQHRALTHLALKTKAEIAI